MICPRWVKTRSQPIAIRDVLSYLIGCLTLPDARGEIFDIGGPDILTYREMMLRFAKILGRNAGSSTCPCSHRGCRPTGSTS